MRGNLFEPMVDDLSMEPAYAELAALNAPPGSVRMRRMSMPADSPLHRIYKANTDIAPFSRHSCFSTHRPNPVLDTRRLEHQFEVTCTKSASADDCACLANYNHCCAALEVPIYRRHRRREMFRSDATLTPIPVFSGSTVS